MITYRGKANKVKKEVRKALARAAKAATRHYNALLRIALVHFDETGDVLAANPLKARCPKPKDLPTYHSEPVVGRIVSVMTRYKKGELGRPRFKNVQRTRWSLSVTVYTQVSDKVLLSCGVEAQSARLAIPGTDVILNVRTDKRIIEGEIKRLAVVSDGCGDIWVNITTDKTKPFEVPETPLVAEMGVDQGCREYAVAVGETRNGRRVKLLHQRPLADMERESERLANAQKNEDWRGSKHIQRRIERKRKHENHVLAAQIVRAAEAVYIGDVSPKFLFANPNSWVARKAADACHAQFRTLVGQKAARATFPRFAYLVREAYSSCTCGYCGTRNLVGNLKFWTCHRCRTWHDRDVNAALNMRFCPIKEDLAGEWKELAKKYQKMRVQRSKPRAKRQATMPIGNSLQNTCVPPGKAGTASSASPSLQ